jgi:hypothetical protein
LVKQILSYGNSAMRFVFVAGGAKISSNLSMSKYFNSKLEVPLSHEPTKISMVKKIVVFLFIMNVSAAFAQSTLRLGAHMDPIVTWFSPKTSGIERDGSRLGYNGGLMVETYFRPNYAFVTGITLTSLGGNLLYNDSVTFKTGGGDEVLLPSNTTVAFNVSYLTLPVALKLKSNEVGNLTYYVQLGFSPQINIGSRATSTGGLLKKDNISEEINLFNLSYFFGGGIEHNMGGQTSLIAGILFSNGLVDILSSNRHKASLNYLTFRIGIMF